MTRIVVFRLKASKYLPHPVETSSPTVVHPSLWDRCCAGVDKHRVQCLLLFLQCSPSAYSILCRHTLRTPPEPLQAALTRSEYRPHRAASVLEDSGCGMRSTILMLSNRPSSLDGQALPCMKMYIWGKEVEDVAQPPLRIPLLHGIGSSPAGHPSHVPDAVVFTSSPWCR